MIAVVDNSTCSPLAVALARFNEVFDSWVELPILAEDVERLAALAALRGRQDIANLMREALAEEASC